MPARSLALLLLLAAAAGAQPAPRDGEVIAERAYRLLPHDSLPADQRRELARSAAAEAYERARRDARYALRKLEYRSDGLRVVAYAYGPAAAAAAGGAARRPVVVYSRGSFVAGDQAPALLPMLHRLAEAGFLVVAPQYRGSDGGEGRDEMGGADVADVLNAVRLAARLPGADSTRLFLYGESRGGMMTYQALRDGAPVRAAAVVGAFTDLDSLLAGDPRSRGAAATIWPGYERDRDAIAPRRSALRWADALRTPLLILHGGADPQVSPRQSLGLALRLDALARPYELHVLAGGTHTLGDRAVLRDSLVVAWFRRHEP